ncbi:MAG: hypothetical protein GF329_10550, partial [Candidatus Lokiarchaeota archaeon]|nr:hypothetical protein [Candidatus Lokiarchaeota archaeon]
MGFKRVSIKELESKLSPVFIGPPIKRIEEVDLLSGLEEEEEELKKGLESVSRVKIDAEETLEYNYDKFNKLKSFIGTGFISISNKSKNNRIWDAQ